MPNLLTRLKIDRVAAVDRGAGEGVRVLMIKRDGKEPTDAEVDTYSKRSFSEEDRQRLSASGAAMPSGAYPIENEGDLRNAVRAYGRGNDKPEVKAHILRRARSLGAMDLVPDKWKSKTSKMAPISRFLEWAGVAKDAVAFDEAQANAEAAEYGDGMVDEICEAVCSLKTSIGSILCDEAVTDKQKAIDESIGQFQAHIQGVVPEGMEKAMAAAGLIAAGYTADDGGALTTTEKAAMAEKDAAKEKEMQDAKDRADKAEKRLKSLVEMSDVHKSYMGDQDATMPEGGRDVFIDMAPAARDTHIAANPLSVGKAKRLAAYPEDVRKALEKAAADSATVADLKKSAEMGTFAKRAVEIGAGESFAETLYKAHNGDKAAVTELENRLKAANAQIEKGKLFGEFGSRQQGQTDVAKEMDGVVADLMKADPKLSRDQAIAKVANSRDAKHQDLWKRYRADTQQAA